ncbi:mechanosensitive ion channel family protein [Stutzerimonas balearica]|uniref:Small-conductance mechanosensitive channel n=1 Tax=Stutzerimonas balearica DSM 6083 TaxID=1123016 RepID=A0A8D3Y063_9GAMM|nr:mechanosensitive ion channel domain-containing protein [Stutzerimonas balearica]AJE14476.1 mechanosensitive ion channel protein MscS [Stutzerimonas balearica DSM 6083]MCF6757837.1 mechanosensitive ion channel [Stutzerimonas balearica]SDM96162.1 small conductance mechanosensitive channel [Stutzerimonas balearica DSM 6083]
MELNVDYLIDLSESWLPLVLQYAGQLGLALITLALGWWLINVITSRVGRLLQRRQVDPTLHGFIGSLASIVFKVLLLVSVASMVGIETTSFVAAIGAAGLAIGLALQGSLSNFAGGVLILLFRPFRVGEFIEAQGISGTVDSIQIFHTILRTLDNKTVIMPNGSLSNGNIINYSRQPQRRVETAVGIDYSADIKTARQVLLGIAEDPRVLREPAPVVVVTGLGDNSVNLALRVWVATADWGAVNAEFLEQAKEKLEAVGIGIPFPQRVVHLVQQ